VLKQDSSQPRQRLPPLTPYGFAQQALPRKPDVGQDLQDTSQEEDYTKQMHRRWRSGDVYAPHDLSAAEQKKWKNGRMTPQSDAFDVLGINPINEYKVSESATRRLAVG